MEKNDAILEAQDLNQQGIVLLKTGNMEAAREKFKKAIDIEPMLMDSYKNYGDLNLAIGEYQEAKNYYKKALLIEKSGVVYFQYGNACFLNDEPHEGLEYYNLALSAGYDSDEMFFFMGMAYEHMNDDNMALRYIQKAISKNPSRPDYKVKKVSVLLRLGMMEDAELTVDELLLNDPELFDGYHMKNIFLLEKKDYAGAIEFSKSASERFPEDAELYFDYAKAVALSGKMEEALHLIENAKKMKYYDNAKELFVLLEAQVYAEKGDMSQAIESCRECIALEGEGGINSEARFMLINLYLTEPDFEKALEQACALADANLQDSYYFAAIYYRAYCTKKLGKDEEAANYYKEAVSLYRLATLQNEGAFDAYLYRAMCLKDMEQYDGALELLDFMEQLDDGIAEVHTIRADIYKLTDRQILAKEELEKAFALKPELREVLQGGGE